jgi:hypothetical protein
MSPLRGEDLFRVASRVATAAAAEGGERQLTPFAGGTEDGLDRGADNL